MKFDLRFGLIVVLLAICGWADNVWAGMGSASHLPGITRQLLHFVFLGTAYFSGMYIWRKASIIWVLQLWHLIYLIIAIALGIAAILSWRHLQSTDSLLIRFSVSLRTIFAGPLPLLILSLLQKLSGEEDGKA
jgi:hypothetical protein